MTDLCFMFRADATNVGDWWCPPLRYFPFKPARTGDILDTGFNLKGVKTLVLGGGGIGTDFFRPHLQRLQDAEIETTILWGGGVDSYSDSSQILAKGHYDLYGDYFDFIDEVGIRVHSEPQRFRHVPCASCMNNLFFRYREMKPTKLVGCYSHKRVPLLKHENQNIPEANNDGNDLEAKLRFLASHEYIVTNTYHGVYWATLLSRKVVVIPFKSGLTSFEHPPQYSWDGQITDEVLHGAHAYDDALEVARDKNVAFFRDMTEKYSLV